jgi:hypothetical protein
LREADAVKTSVLRIPKWNSGMLQMQLQGIFEIGLLIVSTEAITEAIFRAGPLQPAREWIIDHTDWLYSESMRSHLLECKYCTSFWVASFMIGINFLLPSAATWLMILLTVHRLSNFLHLPFSWLRDKQLNIRIDRNRG